MSNRIAYGVIGVAAVVAIGFGVVAASGPISSETQSLTIVIVVAGLLHFLGLAAVALAIQTHADRDTKR